MRSRPTTGGNPRRRTAPTPSVEVSPGRSHDERTIIGPAHSCHPVASARRANTSGGAAAECASTVKAKDPGPAGSSGGPGATTAAVSGRLDDEHVARGAVRDGVGHRAQDPALHALAAHHDQVRPDVLGHRHQHVGRWPAGRVGRHLDPLGLADGVVQHLLGGVLGQGLADAVVTGHGGPGGHHGGRRRRRLVGAHDVERGAVRAGQVDGGPQGRPGRLGAVGPHHDVREHGLPPWAVPPGRAGVLAGVRTLPPPTRRCPDGAAGTPPAERYADQVNRRLWEERYEAAPRRPGTPETMSGIPVDPVYGPDDAEYPGLYPYTRGPHASMYRSKLWTMRMFAGFGTPEDTNARFKELLRSGGTGLSTAFDLPTLMGRDSDDPISLGEVGKAGVAVDTLADMDDLFSGIDLGAVTTSMTINSPAIIMMAMYIAVAEAAGVPRARLGGTLQNDILKEYQAQKEFIFPPRPSVRLVADLMRFCTAEMPRWHPVSVSGYHIREAGSTAAQELAFTLANGFAYVEAAVAAGLDVDEIAPRLSFFFNAHIDFFEEIGKFRAARRLWATTMRGRYGSTDERSQKLRFHTQTAGVSLTAQQPEVNMARVAIEALAGVLGGTQSLHTDSYDEALALPSEKAARLSLRTQQVIAEETGVAHVADPLGGSWFVESLTDEMEHQAAEIFAHIEAAGHGSMLDGVIACIEDGWFTSEIGDSAYQFQTKLATGRWVQVGVNGYTEGDDGSAEILYIEQHVEDAQRKRLAEVKQARDADAVDRALAAVRADAAEPTTNLVPAVLDAVRARATEGEIIGALGEVFGTWVERPTV